MDMDRLRPVIDTFSFERCKGGNQGFNRILIQLFGLMGHGKSSFINTCIFVWQDGEYQSWAKTDEECGGGHHGGLTMNRIPHKLTSNITLVDNRGLVTMNPYETGEIFAQLGNLLPLGKQVEWSRGFGLVDRIVDSEKTVKTSDFIVPVLVHSLKKTILPEERADLKALLHTAKDLTGIFPIVVLTHKTFGNLVAVEYTFKEMGIERIFAFENYTREDHFRTRGRHEEVLSFLKEVIRDAQFRVEHQKRDPVKEMQERKQFVLNYVHERELKMEQEHLGRKRALEQAIRKKKLQKQEEELERERQRRRQAQEDEERRLSEEFGKQRLVDQARHEEEFRAQEETIAKKPKRPRGIFGWRKKK
ncbi:uncharacterized protein LOC120942562 [Rana temporaria]|uniref:uncharacterized protein LOC120942562 n=1 Tax=Rana temporaria TaxID=8407 RepID=UPI001AAC9BF6|nr:uncharacterized protein LOC120942562 [Rana temporaria]XP_040211475.1 uncharacterized protein LOC120942562 [Rana temporaria]